MKIIPRSVAKEQGLRRYFSGKPCPKGHVGWRSVRTCSCCVCNNERTKAAQKRDRAKITARQRVKRWGSIVVERPDTGVCEICGGRPQHNRKALDLDHCHKTNKFRGWLCGNCNLGLGKLGDTEELVERALEYLRRNRP